MNARTPELARTQALILAGGQGERLSPLTVSRPKPAVSFGGMFRIIDFTLSNCLHSGIGRVSMMTQYRHEELHSYIRDGWSELWEESGQVDRSPLTLLPPTGGKRYRGTADAVFQNRELLQSDSAEHVLVLSGDHIYHMDYSGLLQQHAATGADLTIATVEHPLGDASHFGVVEVDRNLKVTGFEEKPANPRPLPSNPRMALVSMGVYVFKKDVLLDALHHFCETGRGHDFGRDIIPSLIQGGRTSAFDFRNEAEKTPRYWRDIGTVDGYYKASMDLVSVDAPFDPYANEGWPSQPTRHPSLSARSVSRSGNARVVRSVLGPDIELAGDVRIEDSILLPGVRVGKGAQLRRAIVDEGVQIPAGFQVGFDLAEDRRRHTVTDSGVVVVSKTPRETRSTIVHFVARGPRDHAARTA